MNVAGHVFETPKGRFTLAQECTRCGLRIYPDEARPGSFAVHGQNGGGQGKGNWVPFDTSKACVGKRYLRRVGRSYFA